MNIKAQFKIKDKIELKICNVCNTLTVDAETFDRITANPQKKYKAVNKAIEECCDNKELDPQQRNCLLVLGENTEDGILFDIKDSRRSAFVPFAKRLVKQEEINPALQSFMDKANKTVNEIIAKACKCNDGEKYEFGYEKLGTDSDVDLALILKMISENEKVDSTENTSDAVIIYPKKEYLFNGGEYSRTLTEKDTGVVNVTEAYNKLWVYDNPDGKQANFSRMKFKDLNFFSLNFNNSVIKNSEFRNCNLNCLCCNESEVSGTVFINCDMRDCAFEKSNMTGCKFINCDLSDALLKGANLLNSAFYNCEFLGADFDVAYMEGCEMIDNRDDAQSQGVPLHDKESWEEAMQSQYGNEETMQEVM